MSNKEISDLKTLIKALEIRLNAKEITEEEYTSLMEKYENRLNEEVKLVKENSLFRNLSYVSISGSGKVTDAYISISGSGRIEGWQGGTIKISGSGKISEEEIKISGSGVLPGDLVTENLKVSGSLKVQGPLETSTFISSGSFKVEGPLTVHANCTTSGSGKIEGSLLAHQASFVSSGALKVQGDVFCNEAELSGAYKIEGSVKCNGSFTSEINNKCEIKGDLICGGDVYIEQNSKKGSLSVENIESSGEVYLEGVKARSVSGKKVKLGEDCEIDSVTETG
ncbi:MAG: polymer-forming cytoskeletal protein [Candidatus Heimdallarchaeota archaeon]|nr:polymer-forming cytoskeletal protein [Candidatus Heimdallarchaeota archaeon]